MPQFRLAHIPPLFFATTFVSPAYVTLFKLTHIYLKTFGGMIPFWDPVGAMRMYGFPERINQVHEAQVCFTIYASRMTAFGMAIYVFYFQRKFAAMDTILALMPYVATVDAYVALQEGDYGRAVLRFVSGLVIGGWGALGLTRRWS